MMDAPTADEIVRWTEQHQPREIGPNWLACRSCGTGTNPWPCPTTRLLALVAAQAEQNAGQSNHWRDHWRAQFRGERDAAVQRAERAEAELSALRATDEYQRWAWAVTWRDAVKRVQALCDEAERTPRGITINGTKFPAHVATTDVRAALNGEAAT